MLTLTQGNLNVIYVFITLSSKFQQPGNKEINYSYWHISTAKICHDSDLRGSEKPLSQTWRGQETFLTNEKLYRFNPGICYSALLRSSREHGWMNRKRVPPPPKQITNFQQVFYVSHEKLKKEQKDIFHSSDQWSAGFRWRQMTFQTTGAKKKQNKSK